jgi:protease-4
MSSFLTKKALQNPTQPAKKGGGVFRFFGRVFMMLGIMMFISMVISVVSFFSFFGGAEKMKPLPDQFVLAHSFKGTMPEMPIVGSLLAEFIAPPTSLYDFMRTLNAAKNDDRVTAFVARVDDGEYSLTQIETIRNAVIDFRTSGKSAYIYANSIGGFSNGTGEYWLASAFDEIWVQPVGTVSVSGIYAEQPFLKDVLNKVGVEMEMEQRKRYKTGPEMYTRANMSDENRETMQSIVSGLMTKISNDVTNARNIEKYDFDRAVNVSPLTVEEAKRFNLIDKIAYVDELEDHVKQDSEQPFIGLGRYVGDMKGQLDLTSDAAKIAFIKIEGMILDADPMASLSAPKSFVMPENIAEARQISSLIDEASKDENIKVIVLRINSPGGSPTASETIRRAVVKARKKGKFVIASMGDVAASGGYWIAVNANQIIASDVTITGSIGVYGGIPNLKGLWDKIGLNFDHVSYGDNAGMYSLNKSLSDGERARLSAMMDQVYKAFVDRVAEGRMMDVDSVENVAQGRAWTGREAKENGLVDLNGGFDFTLKRATSEAGGLDWRTASMMVLPRHKDPFEELMELLNLPFGIRMPAISQTMMQSLSPNAIATMPELNVSF